MKLTAKQILHDVYTRLRNSTFASQLSGDVYKQSSPKSKSPRPRDSKLEDAIVIFTTGDADQIQQGIVTINIYVSDINPYSNGVYEEDGQRCEDIEVMANEWAETLIEESNDYLFELGQAIYTEAEPDINQHFIVIKLKYKLLTY
ncbi:MAG: hypothetical protein R3Y50_06020 [Rikenellaceae bacterium]